MICVFLADGFEEIEAIAMIDILRRAGLPVQTVGVTAKNITGAHGVCVQADITSAEIAEPKLDAIVLPGGMPGTLNLEKSDEVRAAVKYCVENQKYIAAICAAPSILGHLGVLAGKSAVCFPGFEQELFGANITEKNVCVDGKIITAKGPGAAIDFALKIVELLVNPEKSEKIRVSMQCM